MDDEWARWRGFVLVHAGALAAAHEEAEACDELKGGGRAGHKEELGSRTNFQPPIFSRLYRPGFLLQTKSTSTAPSYLPIHTSLPSFSPLPVLEPSSPLHLRGVGGVTHTKDAADLSIPRALPEDLAKLSGPTPPDHSHDRHDIYDSTPPHLLQQRQHAALARAQAATPDLAARTPSPSSSHLRSLRRTPRFDATPSPPAARRVHLEAASVGFAPRVHFVTADAPQSDLPRPLSPLRIPPRDSQQQKEPAKPRRILSQDLSEDFDETAPSEKPSPEWQRASPSSTRRQDKTDNLHPALRISKNTHSAILFALEEALRHPNPFTPDVVEESGEMADLVGSGGRSTPVSNGNPVSSSRTRPTAAPAPTGSPGGIRGPRMIMQERAAREAARQRAELEQMHAERQRAQQEAQLLEDTQRRNSERRAAAAAGAAAGGQASGAAPEHIASQTQHTPTTPQRRPTGGSDAAAPRTNPASSRQRDTSTTVQQRPARTSSQSQSQPQTSYNTVPRQPTSAAQPPAATATQPPPTQPSESAGGARPRNSFPHAFERWETLSAHWEGLTNFWIRRLEENNKDIERDPVNQALSRQVTDLSAAGANLFHAVVELQRLRASSERKFQRWFFETRADLERAQEVNAMLETALDEERRARADAIREAVANEQNNSMNKTRFEEMRKELQISKEEARRAWEELGRREQEERERTLSLQSGQPTIVGGVQVVPMTQGVPSRHGSARQGGTAPQQTEYAGNSGSAYSDEYAQSSAQANPTTSAPAATSGPLYSQPAAVDPQPATATYSYGGGGGGGSEGGYSEKEYETPATQPPSAGYSQPPPATLGRPQQVPHAPAPPQQDYSGQGYGAPGWEEVPRVSHHHPTRLSDVLEEDERSRTSASYSRV
ncbi:hypothetical protein VDGE_01709 [Verticillium dahliae]|uniref:Uncharacterized protein n=2 Tax=Verticillium TaxID=1036719 RepID=A0A444S028_VERDA|nr:hypothetical protein VDGE_01709 [Verticillium dahliae]